VVASGNTSETKAAKKSTAAKTEATPEKKTENDNHRNSHYHRLTYIPTFM